MKSTMLEVTDFLDKEFIILILEIEKSYEYLNKYDKIRVESWCKKLSQNIDNKIWKRNRNLHAILLLDMVLNKQLSDPYNRLAPEGPILLVTKTLVKSRLSSKFERVISDIDINERYNKFVSYVCKDQYSFSPSQRVLNNSKYKRSKHKSDGFITYNKDERYEMINQIKELRDLNMEYETQIEDKNELIYKLNEDKKKLVSRLEYLEHLVENVKHSLCEEEVEEQREGDGGYSQVELGGSEDASRVYD